MVSIAIVVTLIAVFIPGFDNYKKRQRGSQIAQEIIQQVQLARSYALAPNIANFPNLGSEYNIIEIAVSNTASNNNIKYAIGRVKDLKMTFLESELIKSPTNFEGDWIIAHDDSDNEYFYDQLTLGFRFNSGELLIYRNSGGPRDKQKTGYEIAQTRGDSVLPIYIVPKGSSKGDCTASKGCEKIELNLITGAMTHAPYK